MVGMGRRVRVVCSMPALQCRDGRRIEMANTKEQQLQAFARRAARVSRALWPTNVRRAIATNRVAQTRRRLIVTGRYWSKSFIFPIQSRKRGRPHGISPALIPLRRSGRPQGSPPVIHSTPALTMNVAGVTALAGVGIVVLVVMRLWLLLMFFSVALVAIFLLLAIVSGRVSSMRWSQQGAERRSLPGVLSGAHSPNTPMPLEPPLVRVLETFDLSQSDVEHFLDLPEGGNTGGYSLTDWKEAQTSLPPGLL